MIPRPDLGALGALAALAGLVAWQLSDLAHPTVDAGRLEASAGAEVRGGPGGLPPEYRPQVLNVTNLVERPLFWESRRPPDPEPEEQPPPARPPPPPRGLALSGLVKGADRWRVLVRKGRETIRLETGDSLEGWTVEQVSPDSVRLRAGRSTVDLPLYDPPVAPPPAKPPAGTAAVRAAGRTSRSALQSSGG